MVASPVLLLTACGSAAPEEQSSDADFVEASASTRQALGVVRWSRKGAPSVVTGVDADGKTVVELKYATTSSEGGTLYGYQLREHERSATTQFWIGPNGAGTTTFALRNEARTDSFDASSVLALMRADLQGATSGTSTLTGQAIRLSPSDLTDKNPQLVCGTDIILINGAESCLNHQSGDDEWAKACAAQARKSGESAEHNTCWEQGDASFNDCICIDKSNTTVSSAPVCTPSAGGGVDKSTKVCHFVNTGETENNSCGKPCDKQAEVCETSTVKYSGCN